MASRYGWFWGRVTKDRGAALKLLYSPSYGYPACHSSGGCYYASEPISRRKSSSRHSVRRDCAAS
jgi:hypothetical protein